MRRIQHKKLYSAVPGEAIPIDTNNQYRLDIVFWERTKRQDMVALNKWPVLLFVLADGKPNS